MKIVKKINFGSVSALRLGFSPIGRPIMSVYLYYIDGVMIDTGQSNMRQAVRQFVVDIQPKHLLLTHHHEDHSGNAKMIQATCGTEVWGHPLTKEKMANIKPILPYQHLIWGRAAKLQLKILPPLIETERYRILPVHTPGHAKDHTVYLEQNQGWLFSGDMYIGDRIKFFRSDENICQQIESLKKLMNYDFDSVFCGHNPVLQNGPSHIRLKLNYLEDIYGKVNYFIQKGYSESEVISTMSNGSDLSVKIITMGNASFANMVRSAIKEGQGKNY